MAFCTNCGSKIDDEARFCPDCGAPVVPGAPKAEPWEEEKKDFGTKINELNNTPDTTSEFDQNDIQSNKVMAVLAYLGILVLVPLFAARESRYARFHTNQGLVLAIAQFAWTFVSRIIVSAVGAVNETVSLIIGGVCSLVNIAFAVFTVIGIINAAKGTAKELSVIRNITILKLGRYFYADNSCGCFNRSGKRGVRRVPQRASARFRRTHNRQDGNTLSRKGREYSFRCPRCAA